MKKIPVPAKSFPAILFAVVFIAGLLGIIYFAKTSTTNVLARGPIKVTTTPVSIVNKPLEIVLTGTIQSRQAVIITAEIPGRISELHAKEGELVTAGQLLVHIEGSGEQIVVETPNNLSANQNTDLQANYDKLLKEYERYQKLYQMGGIARKQFEDLSARLQTAREALQSDANTGSGIQTQRSGSANLTAPTSGKVIGLAATVGKDVQPGQQLMTLDTGGDVRAVVHLEQKDLYLIKAGTPAELSVEELGQQSFNGQVETIYPEVVTTTPSFLTYIRVENTNGLLKPEMTVTVRLKTNQTVSVRAIPQSAVLQDQDNRYLYLVIDGKVVKQQVNLGVIIGDLVEVTSELPDQAIVLASGMDNLKEGDALTLP